MMKRTLHSHGRAAFTLLEILVAAGIAGIILTASLVALVGFQRVSAFCVRTSEVRLNQVRLLQSIALDLRNCSAATFAVNGTTNQLPLTLTVPKRYSAYSGSPDISGDPDTGSARVQAVVSSTSGKVTIPQSVEVSYTSTTAADGVQTIRRVMKQPSGTSVSRTVATFSSAAVITFANSAGGLVGAKDPAVITSVQANFTGPSWGRTGGMTAAMSDTVFLRGRSIR